MILDIFLEKDSKIKNALKTLGIAFCGSLIIALSKPFSFYLPFTLIPIVLQSHVILLVAFLLGKTRGALAVAMFLMQGIMGFPVIGSGAMFWAVIYGPTSGYLLGYLMAALVMGNLKRESTLQTFYVLLIGNLVVYFFGVFGLSYFLGLKKAITLGLLPFIPLDYAKLLLITKLARSHSSAERFGSV